MKVEFPGMTFVVDDEFVDSKLTGGGERGYSPAFGWMVCGTNGVWLPDKVENGPYFMSKANMGYAQEILDGINVKTISLTSPK